MKYLMKGLPLRQACGVVAALVLAAVTAPAHADMVTQPLFVSTTLVTGTSMTLTDLNLSTPGTLMIELDDLKWPAALQSLSFTLTSATEKLQTFTAVSGAAHNTWTFDIGTAGTYYGSIFATPNANSKAGMYYANVSYSNVAPVPLPAAAWLLLSGVAGLAAFRPKHKLSQFSA